MDIPAILLLITIVGGLVGFVVILLPSFSCRADAYMSYRIHNSWLKDELRLKRRCNKVNTCGDKRQQTLHKFEDAKEVVSGIETALSLGHDEWEGSIRPYSEDFVRKVLRKQGIDDVEITRYEKGNSYIVVKL